MRRRICGQRDTIRNRDSRESKIRTHSPGGGFSHSTRDHSYVTMISNIDLAYDRASIHLQI